MFPKCSDRSRIFAYTQSLYIECEVLIGTSWATQTQGSPCVHMTCRPSATLSCAGCMENHMATQITYQLIGGMPCLDTRGFGSLRSRFWPVCTLDTRAHDHRSHNLRQSHHGRGRGRGHHHGPQQPQGRPHPIHSGWNHAHALNHGPLQGHPRSQQRLAQSGHVLGHAHDHGPSQQPEQAEQWQSSHVPRHAHAHGLSQQWEVLPQPAC